MSKKVKKGETLVIKDQTRSERCNLLEGHRASKNYMGEASSLAPA